MYYYEVYEIGRESVKSVNASILATIIKELVNKFEKNQNSKLQHRKYYIKCKEKLEFSPRHKKNGDDEGFESDANEEDSLSGDLSNEDAHGTASLCYFVEDHVFKAGKTDIVHQNSSEREPTSLVSIIGSIDSANSSGSSDTDEVEVHSLTPSPVGQAEKQSKTIHGYAFSGEKKQGKQTKEEYPIGDVIFCHTEAKYPGVIAWVIKKPQADAFYGSRLGKTGVENFSKVENCLEVIVVKCKNNDNLRDLCANYQEYSKRIKLDQYKTIKRKRDERHASLTRRSTCSKDVKVSLSDMKAANSCLIKASELSILNPKIMTSFSNDLKSSVSLNSLNKADCQTSQSTKMGPDVKAANQPFHSSFKKTQSLMNLTKPWDLKSDTLSRNGNFCNSSSILKDQFNLIQRTDLNGVTHLEISKAKENKPATERFSSTKSKLRREIEGVILTDVDSYGKKEQTRQRQGSENDGRGDTPPIRPERKKFLRKAGAAHLDDLQSEQKVASTQPVTKSVNSFFLSPQTTDGPNKDQRVLKGPYVRVQSWGSQHMIEQNPNSWQAGSEAKHVSRYEDKFVDRRRSKSAGRPPKKTPMAYRYVDIVNDYRGNPSLKCGIPQKIGANSTDSMYNFRRRKSFDDIIAFDNLKGNLKSVIKKNKINDKYCEPKKVTFSAFATVQVVD